MICDHHVYYDQGYFSIEEYKTLFKKFGIDKAVFSPPCTLGKEPKKSELMYLIQRKLLINYAGYQLSKKISKLFYNENNELKILWKIFSGNRNLKKIIFPDNQKLYSDIIGENSFKMWYWINPNVNLNLNYHTEEISKLKEKIFGLKFHLYWHDFEIEKVLEYEDLANRFNVPIYIILGYLEKDKLNKFLKKNSFQKILFGYGGFPMFDNCWKNILNYENCYVDLASNHIDKNIIKKICNIFRGEKIIFSSDCPYNFQDRKGNFDYSIFNKRLDFLEKKIFNSILTNAL